MSLRNIKISVNEAVYVKSCHTYLDVKIIQSVLKYAVLSAMDNSVIFIV